jgi:hypothetical protein
MIKLIDILKEIKVNKPKQITADKLWDYIVNNYNHHNYFEIVYNILNNKYKYGRKRGQSVYDWLKTLSPSQLSSLYKDLKNEFGK